MIFNNGTRWWQWLAVGWLSISVCAARPLTTPQRPASSSTGMLANPSSPAKIYLGIDVLARQKFSILQDKRVGLLTHPAGVNRDGRSTIEVLRAGKGFRLTALFGPEHGLYGDEKANVKIADRRDPRTGLPVYSLYGDTRRPTASMLQNLDVMVIDLQDLGVRSYTYASAMLYTMEECFKAGKEVVVLDRPNPLGGMKVDGPPLDPEWRSYVGAFPVPYVHGLTIGELARLAQGTPGWMQIDNGVRRRGSLTVIPMQGWKRWMRWTDTGLTWVPTSPAIPDLSAAMGYAMTGLGAQLGGFKHGYGTRHSFRLLQYPGRSPEELARILNSENIPGLEFRVIASQSSNGQPIQGVYPMVVDWAAWRPTQLSFYLMRLACQWAPDGRNPFAEAPKNEADLFNKHTGSSAWWAALTRDGAGVRVEDFTSRWAIGADLFSTRNRPYRLY